MEINTTPIKINASDEVVFQFLNDLNNYEKLFPEEKIKNWTSTTENCLFEVKKIGKIGLKKVASTPNTLVYLDSEKAPFKFTLNLFIHKINQSTCDIHLEFEGEINPFLKMMVEKPLTKFFSNLAINLAKQYN